MNSLINGFSIPENFLPYKNNICSHSHKPKLGINEAKNKNSLNPIFMECSNNKSKRKHKRDIFFVRLHNKISISILVCYN